MRTIKILLLVSMMLAGMSIGPRSPTQAQGELDNCLAVVQTALASLENLCGGLGRNSACYGHNRVDATFWQARDDLIFSNPADRVALVDLQTLSTTPLDVAADLWGVALLEVQANLPDVLPGQAVTFMLMGNTSIENQVPPEEAVTASASVTAVTLTAANLRSRPSPNANVPYSVPAGTELLLIGKDESGEWFQAFIDKTHGRLWINWQVIRIADQAGLDALPVTYGPNTPPRYGPMQAFYFTTGLGAPTCTQAPDAVVIQSTELADVTLRVNNLDITIGSTVVLMMVQLPDMEFPTLLLSLLEGGLHTTINGVPVVLSRLGDSVAIALGEDGVVDDTSHLLPITDPDLLAALSAEILAAGQAAAGSGLFSDFHLPEDLFEILLSFYTPPVAPPSGPTPILPQGITPGSDWQPGQWGGCGSCNTCGHDGECVLSPEGACLWDPGTCGQSIACGGDGTLRVPACSYTCSSGTAFNVTANFVPGDGSTLYMSGAVSSNPVDIDAVADIYPYPTQIPVTIYCEGMPGAAATVTIYGIDSLSRNHSVSFTVAIK